MTGPPIHLWLRDETKPNEKRTPLTPLHARKLLDAGMRITVESSETRVFADQDYRKAGCALMPSGFWKQAPLDAFILGLKELPDESAPLPHRHIYFAHAFKKQAGWKELISRFTQGKGSLYDLEFLTDDSGRRVAAFGRWAGFAGAAVGVDLWSHQILSPRTEYAALSAFLSQGELVSFVRDRMSQAMEKSGRKPKTLVIGARGRCGSGAHDLLVQVGLGEDATLWDKDETVSGGPFDAILEHEILVNCVLVQGAMPPFLTETMLDRPRSLSVVSDVSCDPSSPFNPLPIYKETTTFTKPALPLRAPSKTGPKLDLTAIDHLPSLLPCESSEDFSSQLLDHLLDLPAGSSVWSRAETLFRQVTESLYENA